VSLPPGPAELPVPALCLVVLDGWGLARDGPGNAVSQAETPVFDELWAGCPHTTLRTCGPDVGLPAGQMGNSEVGHLNLGAGAIVPQDLARIDAAVRDGSLRSNDVLCAALGDAERVHLLGLVSDGGVHASLEHLQALVTMAVEQGAAEVVVHAFTDGRDTLPSSGAGFLARLQEHCAQAGPARVGSVIGRFYAMDRDQRWERTQQAYDLLVAGQAPHRADSAEQAARDAYDRDETDEFIAPTLVGDEARIRPGDSVLCFNFRPDRARQLTRALAEEGFGEVDRHGAAALGRYATLTRYVDGWPYPAAFPPRRPKTTLARVLADRGLAQLHVAETEKYAHVTYFFNGGEEQSYPGEQRELVPSPRDVPTYDLKPQMSARAATDALLRRWRDDRPAFAIINFANPDMVGHTGVIPAAVAAIEVVDACLGDVVRAVHDSGAACVITADHGNAEQMLEPDGSPNTAHSLNPVPLVVTAPGAGLREQQGILADVAPTVLGLLGFEQPEAMTARSLLA